ncbi:MAG: hypothetical protein OEX12_01290 [Gammaproteobacteria bacterium]|nr:hypothetical protein [Gammaproteobacteria bacterium]
MNFTDYPKVTYSSLVEYFRNSPFAHYDYSPISLLAYRIKPRLTARHVGDFIVLRRGSKRFKFDIVGIKHTHGLGDVVDLLSQTAVSPIRLLGVPTDIEVNSAYFKAVDQKEEVVYDANKIADVGNLSKSARKNFRRNQKHVRLFELTPARLKDATTIRRLWRRQYQNKGYYPADQETSVLKAIRNWNADVRAAIAYRDGLPAGFYIADNISQVPHYGVSAVAKSLNYSSIPGGGNSTSAYVLWWNAITALDSGITRLNSGPWTTGHGNGLKNYKLKFACDDVPLVSVHYEAHQNKFRQLSIF